MKRKHSSTSFIKNRVSIHERPSEIEQRHEIGHWEVDLMQFSKKGSAVLVAHERYSRLLFLTRIQTKEAHPIAKHLIHLFTQLPKEMVKTVTFDNGTEFAEHHQLNQYHIKTYFCDAYSPWQKGGVENAIGRMRRFLPRKIAFDDIDDSLLTFFESAYNLTPRKCIGYKTPVEIFNNNLLHFKCERSFWLAREWFELPTRLINGISV